MIETNSEDSMVSERSLIMSSVTQVGKQMQWVLEEVAYPLLRVQIEPVKKERTGSLPPSRLRLGPTSIEPLGL